MKRPVIALTLLLASAACRPETVNETNPIDTARVFPDTRGNHNATVRYLPLEGGCWVLQSGGTNYEPINLPASYRVDGLRVNVRFRHRDDMASVCMVGPIVSIESISRG